MIGCNEDCIVAAQRAGCKGYRVPSSKWRMITRRWNDWDERIVVVGARSTSLDEFDELQRGALSHVVEILLVSESENENTCASQSLPKATIDRLRKFRNDQMWHSRIDLTSKLDEASRDVVFARFPGEIEGVNRNAMAPQAGSRIERHEAERLRFCRLDYVPDVD